MGAKPSSSTPSHSSSSTSPNIALLEAVKSGDEPAVRYFLSKIETFIPDFVPPPPPPPPITWPKGAHTEAAAKLLIQRQIQYQMLHQPLPPLPSQNGIALADRDGDSALHWAAFKGHVQIARLLIEKKAEVDILNKTGWTPLHWASMNGHVEMAKFLIEHKANVDKTDKEGWSAIQWAASWGHPGVVDLLAEHRANLNLKDKEGNTPLHHAVLHGQLETAEVLLERKANYKARNEINRQPLDDAEKYTKNRMVELFESYAQKSVTDEKQASTSTSTTSSTSPPSSAIKPEKKVIQRKDEEKNEDEDEDEDEEKEEKENGIKRRTWREVQQDRDKEREWDLLNPSYPPPSLAYLHSLYTRPSPDLMNARRAPSQKKPTFPRFLESYLFQIAILFLAVFMIWYFTRSSSTSLANVSKVSKTQKGV